MLNMKLAMNRMLCMEMSHKMNHMKMDRRTKMQLRIDWHMEMKLLNHTLVTMTLMGMNRKRKDGMLMRNQRLKQREMLLKQRHREMMRVIQMMESMNHYHTELMPQQTYTRRTLRKKNTSSWRMSKRERERGRERS